MAAYGLYLQLGAHLLHDDFEEHVAAITTDTDAFAAAIDRKSRKGTFTEDESILSKPDVARSDRRGENWKVQSLKVFLNRGTHLIETNGDGHRFVGAGGME